MFCKKCGKPNPANSSFCQHCGEKLMSPQDSSHNKPSEIEHEPQDNNSTLPDSSHYPYVISTSKLIVLSVTTLGLYEIHWFYKHFKSFKAEDNWKVSPLLRAIFATFSSYTLFRRVSEKTSQVNKNMGLNPIGLAVLYFVFRMSSGLGDDYWWIGLLTFIPLIPAQNAINSYWAKKYGNKIEKSGFGTWNIVLSIIGGLIVLLALYGTFLPEEEQLSNTIEQSSSIPSSNLVPAYNQEEIASSVVNIFCPSIVEGEEGTGGSGTIITEEGVILTNSHIIPQDEEYVNVDEQGCIVILPNPSTGQAEEMYWATPIVLPEISDTYDLAYLYIHDVYYDEETQEYMGTYPRTFPAFDDSSRCVDENIKLGEKVTIFGYPSLSGGLSLTITDGLVSSFPGDGLIVTSAKISEGNSGGLAVDGNGCMIGVPSMVSYDETESLGVIISSDLIREFSDEVTKYLEE